jgi:Cof subfamily protein (haloacid dehalogenase superfamily)
MDSPPRVHQDHTRAVDSSAPRGGADSAKKRLAIIDLDGTLLGPDKRVSPENRRAVEWLRDAGYAIAFASGRHHENIVRFEREVGPMEWVISTSGAVVRHARTSELLHELTLAEADAIELFTTATGAKLAIIVYHREGVFMDAESVWTRLYAARAGWNPRPTDLRALAATGVQKVMLAESAAIMREVGMEIERAFKHRLYAVWTEDDLLEFLSREANKAVGAELLARTLGIDRGDVVAFWDGNNDVEVLAWAGYSVAMAHGQPAAKAAARHVSPAGAVETAFARAVELALGR